MRDLAGLRACAVVRAPKRSDIVTRHVSSASVFAFSCLLPSVVYVPINLTHLLSSETIPLIVTEVSFRKFLMLSI